MRCSRDIQEVRPYQIDINPVYSTRSLPGVDPLFVAARTGVSGSAQRGRTEANRWPRSSTQKVLQVQTPQAQHAPGISRIGRKVRNTSKYYKDSRENIESLHLGKTPRYHIEQSFAPSL